MLKKIVIALVATTMSIGMAQARISGMSSLTHAHFPTCAQGLVKANCVCRAAGRTRVHQLCTTGRYCHTFDGACTQ
ncbi:MAG TPA: hypothetical protein VMA30_16330 [Xanthobacteraceae bacterium]|nr:hypothetical protein [Xanthobacteraceae bacterium]